MKNTFWISTASRTGSMWLFNVVREIFIISNYRVFPQNVPKSDEAFLEIYKKESLKDDDKKNKFVFKVHSILDADLPKSKILTTIRDPRDVCASFKEFMKTDFDSAMKSAKSMIYFVNHYMSFKDDYLKFFKYEDIVEKSTQTILDVSKFVDCEINHEEAELISEKFNKKNVKEIIKNVDQKLLNKIKNKGKIDPSEIVYHSKDNYRAFDTQTGFQSNHISQRDNGEWKKAFSQKEIDIINSDEKLSSFCEKFNYD